MQLCLSNHAQVNTCGFPPLEDREASLSLLMGLDFFGGGVIPAEETVSSIAPKNLVGVPPPPPLQLKNISITHSK
jgi:hypothetical protein